MNCICSLCAITPLPEGGVAEQIKLLRDEHGWTQEELGQRAGIFQNRISVLENPHYGKWSQATLGKLARAFGMKVVVRFER